MALVDFTNLTSIPLAEVCYNKRCDMRMKQNARYMCFLNSNLVKYLKFN